MSVVISVGKRVYSGTKRLHAEEVMFASGRYDTDDFEADMNAWPCTGERYHNCHDLFLKQSAGRRIVLNVTGDKGGYAFNHDLPLGATGQIIYDDGEADIQED